MNKKIFTLLVGAIMIFGSVLTVNAQTELPYSYKTAANQVNFRDILTADTVKQLFDNNDSYYYLLSVTGIANADRTNVDIDSLMKLLDPARYTSLQRSFVLSVDDYSTTATNQKRYLRLENLATLDTNYVYSWRHTTNGSADSHKFGALRHALWCLKYDLNGVAGSNVIYDFRNMQTGVQLSAPFYETVNAGRWTTAKDNNRIYKDSINMFGNNIVSGWHFSQTYKSNQNLQTGMPLYSYVNIDTVAVFVLDDNATRDTPYVPGAAPLTNLELATTGGYRVTVKNVAIRDLIADAIGNVRIRTSPTDRCVDNVLLFTLKKVNRFVMNANDWNAFGKSDFTFDLNANTTVTNKTFSYINPFTDTGNAAAADATGLRAFEVNDSLYHYGYMQFLSTNTHADNKARGLYLQVDTAFANYGNNQYLAFGWSQRRDSTRFKGTSYGWGGSFLPSDTTFFKTVNHNSAVLYDTLYLTAGVNPKATGAVYWRMDSIVWAIMDTILSQNSMSYKAGNDSIFWNGEFANLQPSMITVDLPQFSDIVLKYEEIHQEALDLGFTIPARLRGAINTVYGNFEWNVSDYADDKGVAGIGGMFGWPNGTPFLQGFIVGVDYVMRDPGFGNTYRKSYDKEAALRNLYKSDSVKFLYTYMSDSIMENQSKFRVVYDPTYDSTFINVYQTRVRYPDYTFGAQNATWPAWWTNSFGEKNWGTYINKLVRPSDLFTESFYDGLAIPLASGTPRTITEAAQWYYDNVVKPKSPYSDVPFNLLPGNWVFEGHGQNSTSGLRITDYPATAIPSVHNLHSFMEFYPQSTLAKIDRVLISTADTCRLYDFTYNTGGAYNYSGLSHVYGWSTTSGGTMYYRDSLFYIDLQDLSTGSRILTLDQTYKAGKKLLDTRIKLSYGAKCEPPKVEENKDVMLDNDLYLIRNTDGQYLCVPIWSITDSIYWVTPEANEDPTKMPCYQWIVKTIANSRAFSFQNREFSGVHVDYATLEYSQLPGSPFSMTWPYSNATFNKRNVIGKATPKDQPVQQNVGYKASTFIKDIAAKFPVGTYSFIRLGSTVKGDYTIGYKYVDKDSTYIDVYAFKFLHFLSGGNAEYLSWRGYNKEYKNDTTLYAVGRTYYDKLYFMLQEMESGMIWPTFRRIVLTDANTKDNKQTYWIYKPLYDKIAKKSRLYTTTPSIVFEHFGYWKDGLELDIPGMVPMVRQAYRLFLQDYYRWHPTLKGHYVTVGEQNRYILADKAYALNPYRKGQEGVTGLFGIPHFYFRNTYFDVTKPGDDYFGIVQRIDTARIHDLDYFNSVQALWGTPQYGDIADYLERVYDTYVAKILLKQIRENNEFSLALLDIQHAENGEAKFVIRGDAFVNSNISAFQLERDEDPIYRRFRNNEPDPWPTPDRKKEDKPEFLEFHFMNDGEGGQRLYENSGNYLSPDQNSFNGEDGGRSFNRDVYTKEYYRDTLGHVISFLGDNNTYTYPNTNYAFFVDTAYINRGTGWIKPQYLIAVDPYNPVEIGDCDPSTGEAATSPNVSEYWIARYMFNSSQYAKEVKDSVQWDTGSTWRKTDRDSTTISSTVGAWFTRKNFNKVEPVKDYVLRDPNGKAYIYDGRWERPAFSWAIHYGDKLYVLKGTELEPGYKGNTYRDYEKVFETLIKDYGTNIGSSKGKYINFKRLEDENIIASTAYREVYPKNGDLGGNEVRTYNLYRSLEDVVKAGQTIGLQAIIRLDDNTHKDWVWSFRYIERHSSDFVIESETSERNIFTGAMIRPGYGGWLKVQNGVPVITRSDLKDNMGQAEGSVYNVQLSLNAGVGKAVNNEAVAGIQIVGGTGAVAIYNAANKKVVISNLLGQTIVKTTLTSDNASLAAPAGVLVVAIEGENAEKVLVK